MAGILLDGLMSDSTFYTTPEDAASTSKAADASSADERAELVLQLLLSGLDGPAPNVGHMLLGFDVEHGPEGMPLPDGSRHSPTWPRHAIWACSQIPK